MSDRVHVRTLSSVDEVLALEPLLREYFGFVSGEIERLFSIVIEPPGEVARALAHAEDVLPPKGGAWVVDDDGTPAGMVFIRSAGDAVFEIKRLYVSPSLRGSGAGRALVARAIDGARALSGRRMVLDSTKNLTDAARLYRDMGFRDCDPYDASDHGTSGPLVKHMIFMEKVLD